LDNLVDVAEDHATGQHNLIGCYASTLEATTRMRRRDGGAVGAAGRAGLAR
jgi:hypothetical protein